MTDKEKNKKKIEITTRAGRPREGQLKKTEELGNRDNNEGCAGRESQGRGGRDGRGEMGVKRRRK